MDLWVRNFIQQAHDLNKATHFYSPTKSYLNVPIDSQRNLWLTYCTAVNEGRNPALCEYIHNQNAVQLGFNLNLCFERQQVPIDESVLDQLTESIDSYVEHIIGIIQHLMGHYFELSSKTIEILACYIRRDDDNILLWKDNIIEFSGKIIFPYARIESKYISKFYHFVLNQLQLQNGAIDDHLTIPSINGLDTLIRPFSTEIVEMYGSSTNEENGVLNWYTIYGYLNNDIKTTYDLSKAFVPGLHSVVQHGIISSDIIDDQIRLHGIEFWLPLFFSNGFHNNTLEVKEGLILNESEAPQITMSVIREGGETIGKIERARQLLNLLAIKRVEEYWSWMDIGEALHSVDSGKEGLKLWKWLTEQSDFKDEEDCDQAWYSFDENAYVDIETLEYFASIDNPEHYQSLREKDIEEAVNKALFLQEHTQIAKAFKAYFPRDFVCSNYEAGQWYYYNKHRWVPFSGNSTLMFYINEDFQVKLEELRADYSTKVHKSRDSEYKSRMNNLIQLIGELIRKLSRNGFKESLCKELKIYYFKPSFEQIRDMNKYYMATPNCVLDFRGGKGTARPGKPQDYITKSTRYPFPENYTWESRTVKETMYYLSQVFRSKSLRKYFLKLLASLVVSGNNDKIFPIFTGGGDNSKSILVRLIEASFGNYAVKLPTSLITERRTGADSATPTLIHSRGAKVTFLQEPNEREVIQSGTVKELTGNDTMYVRDLFQKGSAIIELDVTVVPILVANKIPAIPDCQQAIWNRTRVLDFLSRWSNDAPEDVEKQFIEGVFPMDKFFDRKVPGMAPALLWIAFQSYEDYFENGLEDPKEVLEATENFRVANNIFIHFTRDSVKPVLDKDGNPDMTAFVTLDELFNTFRKWYADQQFRAKMPTKTEFKENLEIIWRQKADGEERKWYALQLNNQATNLRSLLEY